MVADGIATNDEVYLRRWNGDAWVELDGSASGGGVSDTDDYSLWPSLAVGPDNRPVIAWSNSSNEMPQTHQIHTRYWNGVSWKALGLPFGDENGPDDGGAGQASLAVGPDGHPIVAWEQFGDTDYRVFVSRWNGAAWVQVGSGAATDGISGPRYAILPSLAVAPNGRPVLAWVSPFPQNDEEIYVRQHQPTLVPRAFVPFVEQQ
jgi:hypothetical protein